MPERNWINYFCKKGDYMKLFFFLLFSMLSCYSLYSQTPLAQILHSEGTVYSLDNQARKKPLKKGDTLTFGSVLETGANSRVLIQFEKGYQKLVLSHSRITLFTEAQYKKYLQQEKSASFILTLIARKANKLEAKSSQHKLQLFREANLAGNYEQMVMLLEKDKLSLKHPDDIYQGARAYLQLGLYPQAKAFYKQLIALDTYEYRELARFGLFMCLFYEGNQEEAVLLTQNYKYSDLVQQTMQKLLTQ
jgi:tetratricopeptide (TPR) repeat protein